tara:strand:- start:1068 stop:1616 length:549 start_codon:yes stop_codon:yes gene_type:complete
MNNFDLRKYLAENKLLKEDEQPTHRIKTDVYYVNNYEFDGFKEEAVPEYEINDVEDMLEYDEGNHLYIDAGTEGWFDGEMFETIEGSNTRLEPEYVEDILKEEAPVALDAKGERLKVGDIVDIDPGGHSDRFDTKGNLKGWTIYSIYSGDSGKILGKEELVIGIKKGKSTSGGHSAEELIKV